MEVTVKDKITRLKDSLALIRKAADMTAEKLGNATGMSPQYISGIECRSDANLTRSNYIAIRSVISMKIINEQNNILAFIMDALIDKEYISIEDQKFAKKEIENIINEGKATASRRKKRITDIGIQGTIAAAIVASGLLPLFGAIPLAIGTALTKESLWRNAKSKETVHINNVSTDYKECFKWLEEVIEAE